MPVLGYDPWLPRVVFQLFLWAPLAIVYAVQPLDWPLWEPSDLSGLKPDAPTPWASLVLSIFFATGSASLPDCLENLQIWVGLFWTVPPLAFMQIFLLSSFLEQSTLYCTLCIYCTVYLLQVCFNDSCFVLFEYSLLDHFIDWIFTTVEIIIWLLFVILILEMYSRYFDPIINNHLHVNKHQTVKDSPTSVLGFIIFLGAPWIFHSN
jgi:hypothetical protein